MSQVEINKIVGAIHESPNVSGMFIMNSTTVAVMQSTAKHLKDPQSDPSRYSSG
ncbi:MAG: hypothetical protein K0R93_2683 [Anaerosolibacter sp.]|jgi:hypothetical protein|uniref:hypothetical protein n=1 Tax=Anaerosolibacter sp. TaxID=1872527 RepID=UPI00261E6A30|nr:hypothetical protein [Anaerosolibacter sp.]MDF2547785.1 hypothetical protein [Anaerosolibacter sp.]